MIKHEDSCCAAGLKSGALILMNPDRIMASFSKAAAQMKNTYISWSAIREQVKHIYLTPLWVWRVNLGVNTQSPEDVNSSSVKLKQDGQMLFKKIKAHSKKG